MSKHLSIVLTLDVSNTTVTDIFNKIMLEMNRHVSHNVSLNMAAVVVAKTSSSNTIYDPGKLFYV